MRTLTMLLVGAIAAQSLLPAAAAAQSGDGARDACAAAIRGEARSRFPQARDVNIVTADVRPAGNGEAQVRGQGEFDDRDRGGVARFDYGCTYSFRSGATYALDIGSLQYAGGPEKKKDNSGAVAALAIGALIAGAAIAASNDKDHDRRDRDRWFSPSDGIRCDRRARACYHDDGGRYSEKWTRRMF